MSTDIPGQKTPPSNQLSGPVNALMAVFLMELMKGLLLECSRQKELKKLFFTIWVENSVKEHSLFFHQTVPLA